MEAIIYLFDYFDSIRKEKKSLCLSVANVAHMKCSHKLFLYLVRCLIKVYDGYDLIKESCLRYD